MAAESLVLAQEVPRKLPRHPGRSTKEKRGGCRRSLLQRNILRC